MTQRLAVFICALIAITIFSTSIAKPVAVFAADNGIVQPDFHAPLPPGNRNTCRPDIHVDTTEAPDLGPWMKNTVVPILKNWYPVIGDKIAWPVYAPRCSFTIRFTHIPSGEAALTDLRSGTITVDIDHARTHKSDIGMYIHEITHTIEGYNTAKNTPRWVIEGLADWARYYMYKDREVAIPKTTDSYTTGYMQAAYFIHYIQTSYDPGIVFKLNMYGHSDTYSDAIFEQATGKTVQQLWTEMAKRN